MSPGLSLYWILLFCASIACVSASTPNVTIGGDDTATISFQPVSQWSYTSLSNFHNVTACDTTAIEGERLSNKTGDSAGLFFNGIAVYWYSLVRSNSGSSKYTVILDDTSTLLDVPNLTCGNQPLCCQVLFSQTGLASENLHNLTILNAGSANFSVVKLVYTTVPVPDPASTSSNWADSHEALLGGLFIAATAIVIAVVTYVRRVMPRPTVRYQNAGYISVPGRRYYGGGGDYGGGGGGGDSGGGGGDSGGGSGGDGGGGGGDAGGSG